MYVKLPWSVSVKIFIYFKYYCACDSAVILFWDCSSLKTCSCLITNPVFTVGGLLCLYGLSVCICMYWKHIFLLTRSSTNCLYLHVYICMCVCVCVYARVFQPLLLILPRWSPLLCLHSRNQRYVRMLARCLSCVLLYVWVGWSTLITFGFSPLSLLCCSSDRSFTPTHHSYYSPKHEGLMEELLTSHQVLHHQHTVL